MIEVRLNTKGSMRNHVCIAKLKPEEIKATAIIDVRYLKRILYGMGINDDEQTPMEIGIATSRDDVPTGIYFRGEDSNDEVLFMSGMRPGSLKRSMAERVMDWIRDL